MIETPELRYKETSEILSPIQPYETEYNTATHHRQSHNYLLVAPRLTFLRRRQGRGVEEWGHAAAHAGKGMGRGREWTRRRPTTATAASGEDRVQARTAPAQIIEGARFILSSLSLA